MITNKGPYNIKMIAQASIILPLLLILIISGCARSGGETESDTQIICDPGNGGITLPEGFCASVVVDSIGPARHIAVADNGDIYVKTRSEQGGVIALRDTTGNFKADIIEYFSDMTPMSQGIVWETGMAIHIGYIWASNRDAVYRWELPKNGALVPEGAPEIIVDGFPDQWAHSSKSIEFDGMGNLYVNIGSPSNACQQEQRSPGSPGHDPCPELEQHAGIWRFSDSEVGQKFSPDARYATGIRNVVGLDWNTDVNALYVMQHGRDQLNTLWPELYTEEQNAELPAEEMLRLSEGANAGWPYCYYDWQQEKKVLSPEYGGDGNIVGRCSDFVDPVAAFPGHWAPNGMLFYTGDHFPDRYQGGAFVAFHGSWNRAPFPQQGYKVTFTPFNNGSATGEYEDFADGFAGTEPIPDRGAAKYRPMGLAIGPDGALFISDSKEGKIWRVVYTGETMTAMVSTDSNTEEMPEAVIQSTVTNASLTGEGLYLQLSCNTCHSVTQSNETASTAPGLFGLFGREVILGNGERLTADEEYIRESILNPGAKIVDGYMPVMPNYENLITDEGVNLLVAYLKSLE